MAATSARAASGTTAALLVLAGAALFGTIGTAQGLGPDVPAPQLAAARLLLAGAVLVAVAAAAGHAQALSGVVRHAPTWWAGVGQASFNLCFLGAMKEAGVAVGTLVAIGATPILTGLVTRQVSRQWLVATAVAVTGLTLLVGGQLTTQTAGAVAPSAAGILLALGASASYATYIVAGNAAAARDLDTQPYLAAAFSISALLTWPLLLLGDLGWLGTPGGLALVGYMALVPTVVAYSLFNRGLRGVRSSTAATLGLVEPVVAALLAYALLQERLSGFGVVGAGLVLLGLLLIVRAATSSSRTSEVGENAARA